MKGLPFLPFLFFLLVSTAVSAEPVAVHNLRLWQAPDHTRLVLDLSGPLEHRLSSLRDPDRVVLEMDNARLADKTPTVDVARSRIAAVRALDSSEGKLRITLDLRRPLRTQSFMLKPYGQYGHRLVIDLYDEEVMESQPAPEPRAAPPTRQVLKPRDLVIAIDAGHGGEDPGALGRKYKTREKDVTLAISRELHKLVNATPGMKAVMVRDGDYFIELHKRREIAERHKADVFVSIHADSLPGQRANQVRGSSVYALSERGASSALARALADSENASDWIGGMNPREVSRDVRMMIGDLAKDAAIVDGTRLGSDVLGGLRSAGPIHLARVQHAGFAVLKLPLPAILVETAFISNAEEEALLRSPAHQKKIAEGVYAGLKRAAPWIVARRESGSGEALVASPSPEPAPAPVTPKNPATASKSDREHVVKPGETLSAIARQYDIHVEALKFLNGIQGNDLPVGTRLRIPTRSAEL